jgi:hypothetical protein
LATEIGGPISSSGAIPTHPTEGTGSDDPLVNPWIQLQRLSKEVYQGQEPEKLKRERSVRPRHVEDGGGDVQRLIEESVNPYEEALKDYVNPHEETRLMCERSPGPSHVEEGGGDTLSHGENPGHDPRSSFEAHQRSPNCWLVREQLEVKRIESQFEIKRRE